MKTHVKYLLAGKLPTDYFQQLQMSMFVCECDTWWFGSFYEGLPPLILEIHRNDSFIVKLEKELNEFNEELLKITERLK